MHFLTVNCAKDLHLKHYQLLHLHCLFVCLLFISCSIYGLAVFPCSHVRATNLSKVLWVRKNSCVSNFPHFTANLGWRSKKKKKKPLYFCRRHFDSTTAGTLSTTVAVPVEVESRARKYSGVNANLCVKVRRCIKEIALWNLQGHLPEKNKKQNYKSPEGSAHST